MVLFSVIEALNKKYQTKVLYKTFDFLELLYLTSNLFDSKNKAEDMKIFRIYKKIVKKFLIDDNCLIKVDKTLMRIIDEYNNIKKKKKKKGVCDEDSSSCSEKDDCCDDDEDEYNC
jgi:hypothetical protein